MKTISATNIYFSDYWLKYTGTSQKFTSLMSIEKNNNFSLTFRSFILTDF